MTSGKRNRGGKQEHAQKVGNAGFPDHVGSGAVNMNCGEIPCPEVIILGGEGHGFSKRRDATRDERIARGKLRSFVTRSNESFGRRYQGRLLSRLVTSISGETGRNDITGKRNGKSDTAAT